MVGEYTRASRLGLLIDMLSPIVGLSVAKKANFRPYLDYVESQKTLMHR